MPYSPMKKSSCIKMYDSKGKPAGLMAEGSMAYMESMGQEKSNLMQDMPIDNRGISQMSPYKMDQGSPAKETDPSPERQARLDKMKAEREAAQAIKRKEYDVKRAAIQEKRMEKTIARDKALNEKRAAIIEKRKQKDPSYKHHQKKQIVTSQQHLQVGTTPLGMHGPGGTHPDPKKKATTTLSNALASDKDYKEVPGYEERLGGDLDEVVVTGPVRTNKQKRQAERETRKKEKRNTYSKTGIAIKTLGSFLPGGGGKYKRRQLEKTGRQGIF